MEAMEAPKTPGGKEASLQGVHKRTESARANSDRILRLLDDLEAVLFGDNIEVERDFRRAYSDSFGVIQVLYFEAELTDRSTNEIGVRLERFIDRLEIRGAVDDRMKRAPEIK